MPRSPVSAQIRTPNLCTLAQPVPSPCSLDRGWTYIVGLLLILCLSPSPTALWGSSCTDPHHQINHLALFWTVNKTSPYHCDHCPRQTLRDCARKGTTLPAANLLCTVCPLMVHPFWAWQTSFCVSQTLDVHACVLLEDKQTFHALTPKAVF